MPDMHDDHTGTEERQVTLLRQLSIIYFLDEEGDPAVTVDVGQEEGPVSMIELLGLLELAKFQLTSGNEG